MQLGLVVGVVLGGGAGCVAGGAGGGDFGCAGWGRGGGAEAVGGESSRARTT